MKNKEFLESKEFKIKLIASVFLLMVLVLSFFFAEKLGVAFGLNSQNENHLVSYKTLSNSNYLVEYIDVGQGNASFVSLPDGTKILIDGGSASQGEKVSNFLKSRGVSTLDYIIATHADSDHIGGLQRVLELFEVKNILRPFQISGTGTSVETFVPENHEDLKDVYAMLQEESSGGSKISRVTTKTYSDFIKSVYEETYHVGEEEFQSSVTVFYDGLTISGVGYNLEFYAPLLRDENMNLLDYSNTNGFATLGYGASDSNGASAIFSLEIFNDIFLFTGDAPFTAGGLKEIPTSGYEELDFLNSLTALEIQKLSSVSVYLAGHHGSAYSSSEALLNLINPKFCVISVGIKNSYGHPAEEVIERLTNAKTNTDSILQTSSCGTISFGSVDGTLVYATEIASDTENVSVSFYLVATVIFVFLEIIVISVRPVKRKS